MNFEVFFADYDPEALSYSIPYTDRQPIAVGDKVILAWFDTYSHCLATITSIDSELGYAIATL